MVIRLLTHRRMPVFFAILVLDSLLALMILVPVATAEQSSIGPMSMAPDRNADYSPSSAALLPQQTTMGSTTIVSDTTWTVANSPYVISSDLTIATGVTLTLDAGTILKFDTNAYLNVNGHLVAEGTPGDEINFTSLKDDTVGGDTNGDGSATAPVRGDWEAIKLSENGQASLDYAVVRYGGSSSGNIETWYGSNAVLTVNHSTISESLSSGIHLYPGNSAVTVTNSTIENNDVQGINASNSESTLHLENNTFSSNGDDGINASAATLSIANNMISNNGGDGIEWRPSSGVVTPTISNNTIMSNTGDAIFINYDGGSGLPVLSGNTISGNGLDQGIGLGGTLGISMTLPLNYYPDFT